MQNLIINVGNLSQILISNFNISTISVSSDNFLVFNLIEILKSDLFISSVNFEFISGYNSIISILNQCQGEKLSFMNISSKYIIESRGNDFSIQNSSFLNIYVSDTIFQLVNHTKNNIQFNDLHINQLYGNLVYLNSLQANLTLSNSTFLNFSTQNLIQLHVKSQGNLKIISNSFDSIQSKNLFDLSSLFGLDVNQGNILFYNTNMTNSRCKFHKKLKKILILMFFYSIFY